MSICVVVRGPLGIGKTTVGRALAQAMGAELISIDQILEEHQLEEWDSDRISLASFLRANTFAIERARDSLARHVPVIVEGNFYWAEQVDDFLTRLGSSAVVFTLLAPLHVCIERDRQRPEPAEGVGPRAGDHMGEESVRQVYAMVSAVDRGSPVDASGPTQETVRRILAQLPGGWSGTQRPT